MDLHEKTRVPLFAVLGALPVAVGCMVWLGIMFAKIDDTAAKVIVTQDREEKLISMVNDIRERMARIEEDIKHIRK